MDYSLASLIIDIFQSVGIIIIAIALLGLGDELKSKARVEREKSNRGEA